MPTQPTVTGIAANNWTPNTVPDGPDDVATFEVSNITAISHGSLSLNGIVFNPGASAYIITHTQAIYATISGAGITNNSGITQNFVVDTDLAHQVFINQATAGWGTVFTVRAGNYTFGGSLQFEDNATAGEATIIAEGGKDFAEEGAVVSFSQKSSAGHATLIAARGTTDGEGGAIIFSDRSRGGFARVKVNGDGTRDIGNGKLDLSRLDDRNPNFTFGSLEGNGVVELWNPLYGETLSTNLIIGNNNLSTTFGGIIYGRTTDGSLTKIGTGTLTIINANTYGGLTTVKNGKLLVNNTSGSGTGNGDVTVNGGVLGGTGIIAGAVTVGTNSGHRATLTPGKAGATSAALTIQKSLSFNSDATCGFGLNSSIGTAGGVVALGVTINSASFVVADAGNTSLPVGTTFTVINNMAASAIVGTFNNLPDGSTVVAGPNTYLVSYEGGDGNDLTLTVL